MAQQDDKRRNEQEFVLEDILREFHSDDQFVPRPIEELMAEPSKDDPSVEAEPTGSPLKLDSTEEDDFDRETEVSLRTLFGDTPDIPERKLDKRRARQSSRGIRRMDAEDADTGDNLPFSADVFNEAYDETRTAGDEPPEHKTETVRLYRKGHDREETAPAAFGPEAGEATARIGLGRPAESHADPEQLMQELSNALRSARRRLPFALLFCLPLLYLCLAFPLGLPLPGILSYFAHPFVYVFISMLCLAAVGMMGLDIITNGIYAIFCLHPGGDTLIAVSFISCILHCAGIIFFPTWGGYLPVCILPALSIVFSLCGDMYNLRARIASLRRLNLAEEEPLDTLMYDEPKHSRRIFLRLRASEHTDFYDHINDPDPIARAMVWYAPFALILPILCAIVCVARSGYFGLFFWAWSAIAGVVPLFGLYISCALPYWKMARKCEKAGVAVGRCGGIAKFAASGSYVLTDRDLFPEGSVKLNGYKMLAAQNRSFVIAVTAASVAAAGGCTENIFQQLMEEECIHPREATNVEFSGYGGIRTDVDGHHVMVGTAEFMEAAGFEIPEGVERHGSLFTGIDMILCAVFSVKYEYLSKISNAIEILCKGGRRPCLASRDPALYADSVAESFDLPKDAITLLSTEEQVAMNNPDRVASADSVLLLQSGLAGTATFLEAARRYARAVRISTLISLIASAVGCAILCFIVANVWTTIATPWMELIFMAALSLPSVLISEWVSKF